MCGCLKGRCRRAHILLLGERDFGIMLFDMDYSNHQDITPMFYRAVMKNGVIDVAGSEVYR